MPTRIGSASIASLTFPHKHPPVKQWPSIRQPAARYRSSATRPSIGERDSCVIDLTDVSEVEFRRALRMNRMPRPRVCNPKVWVFAKSSRMPPSNGPPLGSKLAGGGERQVPRPHLPRQRLPCQATDRQTCRSERDRSNGPRAPRERCAQRLHMAMPLSPGPHRE